MTDAPAPRGPRRSAALLAAAIALGGCAAMRYEAFPTGRLEGKVLVRWLAPDRFLFVPDPQRPLRFVRADGSAIQPGLMLTDGGSIPRPLWILRNYSPWGYAPAFMVHDWLFHLKQCGLPGHERYTHREAADVMAEVMKTMMETRLVEVDKPTLQSMHLAVSSPVARRLWDEGPCVEPPPALRAQRAPIAEYTLDFDR